jgi:site-specific DNA recombinase
MQSLPHGDSPAQDVLLYGRNSTDDQAEAGTIENQQGFLRNYVGLYRLNVVGEFWDEGVSGRVPLQERPDGRRLLAAARARPGAAVPCYRLDRMGRSLRSLLDAHAELEAAGVAIRSATEPFDTSTSIGKFLFQLLGSLAELEKSTIAERTMLGRDRVARTGKWTGGPIPLGYDLDAAGCLTPSARVVPALEIAEAELARRIFERVAGGASSIAVARWLNSLGVPCAQRYGGKDAKTVTRSGLWGGSRLVKMIRSRTYVGRRVLDVRSGPIEQAVLALVALPPWERAGAQLIQNQRLPTKSGTSRHLLQGLVYCTCGYAYSGNVPTTTTRRAYRYYRCCSVHAKHAAPADRCRGKSIDADALERDVWADCARFIRDPGDAIQQARAEWWARLAVPADAAAERERLEQSLADKEVERGRVLSSYRRGKISEAEADRELDAVAVEAATVRQRIAALRSHEDLARAADAYFDEAEAMLADMREGLDEIERTNNWTRKRRIVQRLVRRVEVRTEVRRGRRVAVGRAFYWFRKPAAGDACAGDDQANARSFTMWGSPDRRSPANHVHILARGATHLPFGQPRFGTPVELSAAPADGGADMPIAMMADPASGDMDMAPKTRAGTIRG